MRLTASRSFRTAALAVATSGLLAGCMGGSGGSNSAPAAAATDREFDVRRYIGPNYCPELRVRPGTEVIRRYAAGHENEANQVQWQASIGNTARECLYDRQGNLTLRVGVSGRVLAGRAGGPGAVSLPLRIAVVKYQEAVLASELIPISVTIPAELSTVFSEVRDVVVPSPGNDRDYILYVGFDDGSPIPLGSEGVRPAAAVEEGPEVTIETDGLGADLLTGEGTN